MGNYRLLWGALASGLSGTLMSAAVMASPLEPIKGSQEESADIMATHSTSSPAILPVTGQTESFNTATVTASAESRSPGLKPAANDSISPSQASRSTALNSKPETPLKIGVLRESSANQDTAVATLYDYRMDDKEVTTVYVRDLPIVTFVEQENQPRPLLRASELVSALNQMARDKTGNHDITLDYSASNYVIKSKEGDLIRFDDGILLVGANRTSLALQATNRLRRLILDAPPLASAPTAVVNRPSQRPLSDGLAQVLSFNPFSTQGMKVQTNQQGLASFYTFAPKAGSSPMTAAHRSLPFGTLVQVTNLKNGQTAVVKINDRGPFISGRIIDLSLHAARAIGMVQSGVVPVKVEVLRPVRP